MNIKFLISAFINILLVIAFAVYVLAGSIVNFHLNVDYQQAGKPIAPIDKMVNGHADKVKRAEDSRAGIKVPGSSKEAE
jgi:hypothetical protein